MVNAQYLKERLTIKDSNFKVSTRESMDFAPQLTILADIFYVEVNMKFLVGQKYLKYHSRLQETDRECVILWFDLS